MYHQCKQQKWKTSNKPEAKLQHGNGSTAPSEN